jgi:colanic acid/amylovoran biosynthesis glycosyltransferase
LKRIGILIPEFPGQTHNFFWREVEALKEYGVSVDLFSTRLPPLRLQSPSWASAAMRETTYLHPLPVRSLVRAALDLILSPRRFMRCFRTLGSSAKARQAGESLLRLTALVLVGVHLGRILRDHGVTHVHVHSCADAANVALFAHVAWNIDYSLTLHNPLSIWGGNQLNKWRHAAFGIVIADWILRDLRSRIDTSLLPPVYLGPMGVNVDVFKRRVPYVAREGGILRVFSCARLNPVKGFVVLLEAIRRLKFEGQQVILTIAGEDDHGGDGYRRQLEATITELDLRAEVHLLGAVSEDRVRSELEGAHVFVLASLEEPLGVAIMEAMAMEVPVVSTDAGGVPDLVMNGINGILVPPGDSAALAAAIHEIGADDNLARRLGARGRMRVEQAFHHRISAKLISDHVK